jgi:hypothetical protein
MQDYDPSNSTDPPDLLRRFIPTPVKARYRVGGVRVMVQTNDFTLLPALPLDVDADHSGAGKQNLEWTLIRDADSHGLLEPPIFLTSGTLTVVVMGTACLVGLDHERCQLLGFIGADIDARTHQKFLVPLLCQMTNGVPVSDPGSHLAISGKEFANG